MKKIFEAIQDSAIQMIEKFANNYAGVLSEEIEIPREDLERFIKFLMLAKAAKQFNLEFDPVNMVLQSIEKMVTDADG